MLLNIKKHNSWYREGFGISSSVKVKHLSDSETAQLKLLAKRKYD